MTKEEVRSISVSKLALRRDSVIYDIGAGTGSIAAECAAVAVEGKVYAVEKNPEALALIEKNKHYHQAWKQRELRADSEASVAEIPRRADCSECDFLRNAA